jgi:hypothetical protein
MKKKYLEVTVISEITNYHKVEISDKEFELYKKGKISEEELLDSKEEFWRDEIGFDFGFDSNEIENGEVYEEDEERRYKLIYNSYYGK